MRFVKILGPAGLLVASLLSWCGAEASDPNLQEHGPARALAQDQRVAELSRFEPTGLSILRPYAKGKIPVVFIHGLWSGPWSWSRMIRELEADASIAERYQFWTFGYSTGDPLPYSAGLPIPSARHTNGSRIVTVQVSSSLRSDSGCPPVSTS
jgi:pimeloyl-ACP methyl ester carboxylesterase